MNGTEKEKEQKLYWPVMLSKVMAKEQFCEHRNLLYCGMKEHAQEMVALSLSLWHGCFHI